MNKGLKNRILKMAKEDQKLRTQAIKGKDKKLIKKVYQCDGKNLKEIKNIIRKYGYPTFDLIGKRASHSFWLLVQHSDRDLKFQEKCLVMLNKAVKNGQAYQQDLEYLTDRILVAKGKKQKYNTQIIYESKNY